MNLVLEFFRSSDINRTSIKNVNFMFSFKVFKKKGVTNDRGVEFTPNFVKEFYKNCEWLESFDGDFIGDPKDADERRDRMLSEMYA